MAVGGALVALAGCAAQPSAEQKVPAAAVTQAPAPVAEKPIDFHTLQETKCPSNATSYQQWVAKFQSYALSTGRPDAVIQTAFVGVKKNADISDRQAKQPEFDMPVWTYLDRVVSQDRVILVTDGRYLGMDIQLYARLRCRSARDERKQY